MSKRIIRASSNKNEIVLDPFGGSGTTLAVAKKLNRQFIGFELSKEYAKNIRERLATIKPGDPLNGPANAARSAPSTAKGRKLEDLKSNNGAVVKKKDAKIDAPLFERHESAKNDTGGQTASNTPR